MLEKAKPRNCTTEITLLTNHGRVSVVVNSRLCVSPMNFFFKCHNFEFLSAKIFQSSKSISGLVVYRTEYPFIAFFAKFEKLLNMMATYNETVFIFSGPGHDVGSGHDVKLHRRQRLQFKTAFLL